MPTFTPAGIVGGGDVGCGRARIEDRQERRDAATTRLGADRHISEVEGGAGMGHADHIAAAVGAQSVEVHGTLRHDATTSGCGGGIDADGGSIGDAMAAGGGAQIAIDPAGDACGGRHMNGERFGATGAAIRLGQVGDGDLAVVAGGVAQGEELVEACSHATFGKVPHFTHWP